MENEIVNRIFLCGFMGAGKSSIGKALAELVNYSFFDLDEAVERQVGLSVKKIFEQKGEAFFRKAEKQIALNFLDQTEVVIALGGGTLQGRSLTMQLKNNGLLVFIECPFSIILSRITGDKKRPLLLNNIGVEKEPETLKNELKTLYENRWPLYQQADITIDSSSFSTPENAAKNLYHRIKEYGVSS